MKKIFLCITAVVLVSFGCSQSSAPKEETPVETVYQPAQVLFIGNSHTNYNNGVSFYLQGFLTQIELPYNPVVEKITVDGSTMSQHAQDATTLAKMAEREWDIMVFQENTFVAANNPVEATVGMQELRFKIPNSTTRLFLFMTWAYEAEPAMLSAIKTTYETTAPLVSGTIVPVGLAFQEILNDPGNTLTLYNPDGIHPSVEGTFLASAMFYAAIYEKDPRLNPYNGGLAEEDASYLKEKAYETMLNYPN